MKKILLFILLLLILISGGVFYFISVADRMQPDQIERNEAYPLELE